MSTGGWELSNWSPCRTCDILNYFCLSRYTLLKMDISGLRHQITTNWVNNTGDEADPHDDDFRSIGHQDTLVPFLMIFGGCLCGIGCILIENIMKKRTP